MAGWEKEEGGEGIRRGSDRRQRKGRVEGSGTRARWRRRAEEEKKRRIIPVLKDPWVECFRIERLFVKDMFFPPERDKETKGLFFPFGDTKERKGNHGNTDNKREKREAKLEGIKGKGERESRETTKQTRGL